MTDFQIPTMLGVQTNNFVIITSKTIRSLFIQEDNFLRASKSNFEQFLPHE